MPLEDLNRKRLANAHAVVAQLSTQLAGTPKAATEAIARETDSLASLLAVNGLLQGVVTKTANAPESSIRKDAAKGLVNGLCRWLVHNEPAASVLLSMKADEVPRKTSPDRPDLDILVRRLMGTKDHGGYRFVESEAIAFVERLKLVAKVAEDAAPKDPE